MEWGFARGMCGVGWGACGVEYTVDVVDILRKPSVAWIELGDVRWWNVSLVCRRSCSTHR